MVSIINVTLTSANMGDVTESEFDAWAAFVQDRIDGRTDLVVVVDQRGFGEAGEDIIRGTSSSDESQAIRDSLRDLWDEFCADPSA
jgi:hypothetical protein